MAAIPQPTVAAITGYALGGGLTLALAADWRIGGDNVRVGAPEILLGLIPGGGGMARLARTVGVSRAKELVFSGRFVDAEEALAIGLLDEMVGPDDVFDVAATWAAQFVDRPARGFGGREGRDRRHRPGEAVDPRQTRRRGARPLRRGIRRRANWSTTRVRLASHDGNEGPRRPD